MKCSNKLFFLRHLKTVNNVSGFISGQCEAEIYWSEPVKYINENFDKIYCSSSFRCRKTLETCLEDNVQEKIIYDQRLLERGMGIFEGMKRAECCKRFSNYFINEKFDFYKTPPQGESFESFYNRVREFYSEYLEMEEKKKILICSHNQTLKLLYLLVSKKEISWEAWSSLSFPNGEMISMDDIGRKVCK